ncbi:MAG: hypothetical protein LBU32_10960 [Clostridiales bacterium]|jgi:hypothetical protein|nr:hypothetical protein [Clostridiales bacterium]
MTSGKGCALVGGEMASKGTVGKTPAATTTNTTPDGKEMPFTSCNIEGDYFKLCGLGQGEERDCN